MSDESNFAPSFARPDRKKNKQSKKGGTGPADLTQAADASVSPEDAGKAEEHQRKLEEARATLLELLRDLPDEADLDMLSLGPKCTCSRCAFSKDTAECILVRLPVAKLNRLEEVVYQREIEVICVECWAVMSDSLEYRKPTDYLSEGSEWDVF